MLALFVETLSGLQPPTFATRLETAVSVCVGNILSDASLQQNQQYTQRDALFPLLLNETFIHFQRKLLVRLVHGLSDTVGTNCSCRWEQVVSAICYSFP